MFAIIQTGGKQYRVEEGQKLRVEMMDVPVGETFETKALMLAKEDEVKIGTPELEGVKVSLKVLRHGRGKKVTVFKYKSKKNYRRKQGHRQPFSELLVEKIAY
ncbi:MAG: 50S ribosomal protein L21 [Bacillota bacterium]